MPKIIPPPSTRHFQLLSNQKLLSVLRQKFLDLLITGRDVIVASHLETFHLIQVEQRLLPLGVLPLVHRALRPLVDQLLDDDEIDLGLPDSLVESLNLPVESVDVITDILGVPGQRVLRRLQIVVDVLHLVLYQLELLRDGLEPQVVVQVDHLLQRVVVVTELVKPHENILSSAGNWFIRKIFLQHFYFNENLHDFTSKVHLQGLISLISLQKWSVQTLQIH